MTDPLRSEKEESGFGRGRGFGGLRNELDTRRSGGIGRGLRGIKSELDNSGRGGSGGFRVGSGFGGLGRELDKNEGSGGVGRGFGGLRSEKKEGDGAGFRGEGCRKCGEVNHFAKECPSRDRDNKCRRCGEEGHMANDCQRGSDFEEERKLERKAGPVTYVPDEVEMEKLFEQQHIGAGTNFDRYFEIPVYVTAKDTDEKSCPKILTFAEAGLTDLLYENVQKQGYVKPTPVQQYAIPLIMKDRDIMACAQTGSGKTAAFLLPLFTSMLRNIESLTTEFSQKQEPVAIIMCPIRELAIQTYQEARKLSAGTMVRCTIAYGGVKVSHQVSNLSNGCNILIGTPGRLMQFIRDGRIGLGSCKYLVLDEADRMLEENFEKDIRELVESSGMTEKRNRQTLMFSATYPQEIQELAKDFLRDNFVFLTIGIVGGANQDITQKFLEVDKYSKKEKLLELLSEGMANAKGEDGLYKKKVMVFVERKRTADLIACFLSEHDYSATSIHGDRFQKQREEAFLEFKKGIRPVLVATAVAARGLDIVGVDHVINYDLPQSRDDYVNRIGRTGRVGNPGRATSFYDAEVDRAMAKELVKVLSDAKQEVPEFLKDESMKDESTSICGAVGVNEGKKSNSAVSEENWD